MVFFFFSSLFHRANEYDINVSRQGNETKMIDLNWYLVVYSGKIESSTLLYRSVNCFQLATRASRSNSVMS